MRRTVLDLIDEVGSHQLGLITSAQLLDIGVADSTVRYRIRQGGPWRRVLPGVYLLADHDLDEAQRNRAALLYAGSPSLLTGGSALRLLGVRAADEITPDEVHVLIPHDRKRASTHFVHVQRAKHWPDVEQGEQVTPAPRAAVDAVRALGTRRAVRAVLSEVVRDGRATLDQLDAELARAQRRRTALARDVLRELREGPISVPELELASRWASSGLPPAQFNPDVYLPNGEFVARPDVLVPTCGVVVEVDSRSYHFSEADWERTMRRHARLTALGLAVLHVPPRRVREDWLGVVGDVEGAVRAQSGRELPSLVVVPARR